jgi:phospholipid transport system substrate-binding protein
MLNRRDFIIAAVLMAIGSSIYSSFAAAQASTGDPKATVQAFYDSLEDTMKHGDELGFDGRYQKLEPVIQDTFDVPVMAKIAIGSEWTAFSPEEKERMLDAFNRYMVTTYAARFKSYKGQQFQVGEVKQPADNRSLVETKIIRSNGDPVALNYLFRPSEDGSWKIIDVYLSGAISEMARMRSDFSATVTGGGANALIAALEKKIVEIKAEPGQ